MSKKLANEYFLDMLSRKVYVTENNPGFFDVNNPEKDCNRTWAPWVTCMTEIIRDLYQMNRRCFAISTAGLMALDDEGLLVRGNFTCPRFGRFDHGIIKFDFEKRTYVHDRMEKEILTEYEHREKYPLNEIYYVNSKKAILDVFLLPEN